MGGLQRREFLKLAGAGAGALVTSGLFADRLAAAEPPAPGLGIFEDRFGVSTETLRKILQAALSKGGDFADLYLEYRTSNQVEMEDDIIKESDEDIRLGIGIRVLKGQKTGYGYTSELELDAMRKAALTAAAIASSGDGGKLPVFSGRKPGRQVYQMKVPFSESSLSERIALVKEGYAAAAAHDTRLVKVRSVLADELQYVTILNSEGLLVSDVRPQARLRVTAIAEDGDVRVTGSDNAGGRVGRAFFATAGTTPREIGVRAAEEAIILLGAVYPLPGDQPVVLGSHNSGVVIHEAVGHPFEADGVWRKTSIMWDKLGQMVANPLVTIYDDATIPNARGSLNIDDEGTATGKAVLVEKGKLTGYLHDRLSATLLGATPNGHGRRASFKHRPLPRMNNTILAPGETPPEEIIKSVAKGFYAKSYEGGMVQGTGKFTFSVNLGYLIEDGKLTAPVKTATLIGTNLQILNEIELVGSDLGFFLGSCGKGGQYAPVTAGSPTFKVRQMTVGGRA
jgi:TldD protein